MLAFILVSLCVILAIYFISRRVGERRKKGGRDYSDYFKENERKV